VGKCINSGGTEACLCCLAVKIITKRHNCNLICCPHCGRVSSGGYTGRELKDVIEEITEMLKERGEKILKIKVVDKRFKRFLKNISRSR